MRFLYFFFAVAVLLFHVALGQTQSCFALGGFCQSSLRRPCSYGSLPANCGINARCCKKKRTATKTCKQLGGYCHVPLRENCPSGKGLPANCGINGRCCKPVL